MCSISSIDTIRYSRKKKLTPGRYNVAIDRHGWMGQQRFIWLWTHFFKWYHGKGNMSQERSIFINSWTVGAVFLHALFLSHCNRKWVCAVVVCNAGSCPQITIYSMRSKYSTAVRHSLRTSSFFNCQCDCRGALMALQGWSYILGHICASPPATAPYRVRRQFSM